MPTMKNKKKKRSHTPKRNMKNEISSTVVKEEQTIHNNDNKNNINNNRYIILFAISMLFFLPIVDYYNHINVGHLLIEFNGRRSVSFVAIEDYHDLRNMSESICTENNAQNFHLCAHQIHVRMKDLLKIQRNDYDQTNLFIQYYLYSSVEIATRYGIFICRFNPLINVDESVRHFLYTYVNFFNFYKPSTDEYISTMKLVEREVKDQILIIGGRKLEVVFVFIHLLIVVGITMFLRFMFSTKFTEEEKEENKQYKNDNNNNNNEQEVKRTTLYAALQSKHRKSNYLNITRFVLTLLVMYGHSFQLVGNKQTGLEPIFYTFLKHDIAIVACSILFFISGILSTKSIIEHHQSMVKFLIQVYKRIFPSYFIMSILCVIIIGSWYANLSSFNNTNNYNDDDSSMMSNVVNYLSHPYGKWLLYYMVSPSGFLHSFSYGNNSNKLFLWPFPGGILSNKIGSRQSFNPSIWTLPLQIECWFVLSILYQFHALKSEYLILFILACILYANNIYIVMFFIGSFIYLNSKYIYLGKSFKAIQTICILIPYAALLNDSMRYNQWSFIPIIAYLSLWFSFNVVDNDDEEVVDKSSTTSKSLFYSNLNMVIYGIFIYGSVVQQLFVDYRSSVGIQIRQEDLQWQAIVDFVYTTIIAIVVSMVNMVIIRNVF